MDGMVRVETLSQVRRDASCERRKVAQKSGAETRHATADKFTVAH